MRMSDMIDMYRDMKQIDKERRAESRESAPDQLRAHGIQFTEHNGGAHLIILKGIVTVDYWPGTGKWISRSKGCMGGGRGFAELAEFLGIKTNEN
jgi:hypothetical protein